MATAAPASGGADSHILREYLVALGFRIDERRQRTMSNTLTGMDKRAQMLGRSLLSAGAAAVTLATVFTRSMERVFYNARYADTTVGKLQAMEFAGRNVGLAGGEMTQGLKGMAAAMRGNPGLVGLMDKLTGGSVTKGKTMDRIMLDFVRATKSMPPSTAIQYAEMFGIGPEMLFNMQQGIDKMEEAVKLREQMAKDMGVDVDQLAKDSVEVSNIWRGLTEHASVFAQALLSDALPAVREMAGVSHEVLNDWQQISHDIATKGASDFWQRLREGATGTAEGGGVKLSDDTERRLGVAPTYEHGKFEWFGIPRALEGWDKWRNMKDRQRQGLPNVPEAGAYDIREDNRDFKGKGKRRTDEAGDAGDLSPGGVDMPSSSLYDDAGDLSPGGVDMPSSSLYDDAGDTSPGGRDQEGFDPEKHLRDLERNYRLPHGLLDRVWRRESQRGDPKRMRSPKGAMGHFGFMPETAKSYGLKNPDDFDESSDASARMWRDLLKQYRGDLTKAAAAYNWGSGNLAKYGLGAMPAETRGYVADVARPQGDVNVNTDIHINGVSNPEQAAELVRRKQSDVAGDVVRNMSPRVR